MTNSLTKDTKMYRDVAPTLTSIPLDIGILISYLVPITTVPILQLVCKRIKLFSDRRMEQLYHSQPTREEVIRWIQRNAELRIIIFVRWYIPGAEDIPSKLLDITLQYFGLEYRASCIDIHDNVNSVSQITKSFELWLNEVIPSCAVADPCILMLVMMWRRLTSEEAVTIATKANNSLVFPVISKYTHNLQQLIDRLLLYKLAKKEKFDVDITIDDLLLPVEADNDRLVPQEVENLYLWSTSLNGLLTNATLSLVILVWKLDPELQQHLGIREFMQGHKQVLLWLEYRIRHNLASRISIFTENNVVVVLEVVGNLVIYRAYAMQKVGRSYRVYHVPVPEDCLLETMLTTKHIPGLVDHETLRQVMYWKLGKISKQDQVGAQESIAKYIERVTDWNDRKLLTRLMAGSKTSYPHDETIRRWVLIAFFWLGLGSNEIRTKLCTSSFTTKAYYSNMNNVLNALIRDMHSSHSSHSSHSCE